MKIKFKNPLNITLKNLKNALSNDMLRPAMNYVYVCFEHNRIVATNAYILLVYGIELEIIDNPNNLKGVMLPARFFDQSKYMAEIPKKMKGLKQFQYEYVLTEQYAEVYLNDTLAYRANYFDDSETNKYKVTYPNYQAVLPERSSICPVDDILVNPKFINHVSNMLPVDEFTPKLKMMFYGKNKNIIIESKIADTNLECFALLMPIYEDDKY